MPPLLREKILWKLCEPNSKGVVHICDADLINNNFNLKKWL